jgi:hypothetical protein
MIHPSAESGCPLDQGFAVASTDLRQGDRVLENVPGVLIAPDWACQIGQRAVGTF